MISVAAAIKIIEENIIPLTPALSNLREAAGKSLAADVYAITDIPAFPQSSMDGYAFSFASWEENKKLQVNGEVPAGETADIIVEKGKAIRIFTGAPVPRGTDTVIMQEKVKLENDLLIVEDSNARAGLNVRPKGSEIRAGQMALEKGTLLTPAAIGFLAAIGINEVPVWPYPVITIIITGNELKQPGTELNHGEVYEANSYTLVAAIQGIADVKVVYADDDLSVLIAILNNALQESDLVLLTGGVSAGDYDFVLRAAEDCGVKMKFHKVKQRPGKPLYFGMKENKPVFGLPGNPSSVLTCFYEYVIPAIYHMSGQKKSLPVLNVPLGKEITKIAGLTFFLKGYYDGNTVTTLDAQESYRLSSFAKANCLVKIDEEVTSCKKGDSIEIHLLR